MLAAAKTPNFPNRSAPVESKTSNDLLIVLNLQR